MGKSVFYCMKSSVNLYEIYIYSCMEILVVSCSSRSQVTKLPRKTFYKEAIDPALPSTPSTPNTPSTKRREGRARMSTEWYILAFHYTLSRWFETINIMSWKLYWFDPYKQEFDVISKNIWLYFRYVGLCRFKLQVNAHFKLSQEVEKEEDEDYFKNTRWWSRWWT